MSGEITRRINQLEKALDQNKLADEAFRFFKDITPVKTGNAKSKTTLNKNEINAAYPYAGVLDKGRHMTTRGARGSYQAPDGMTKPTERFVQEYIKKQGKG